MPKEFKVQCPCCDAVLYVNRSTGKIDWHEKPGKQAPRDLDDAFSNLHERPARHEEAFGSAMENEKNRGAALEDLFRQARDKAGEDDSKPPSIFDCD